MPNYSKTIVDSLGREASITIMMGETSARATAIFNHAELYQDIIPLASIESALRNFETITLQKMESIKTLSKEEVVDALANLGYQ